jgi:uncharacterized delta-60 repeat protein
MKRLLLTLVLASLTTTTTRPLVINKNTPPKWTYQTITAGTLDDSFGTNGTYTVDLGGDYDAIGVMGLQSDGKIIIAGSGGNSDWYVQRLNPNGSLDATFGNTVPTDGTYTVDLGEVAGVYALQIQPDDKILIGGYGSGGNSDWYVQRLNPNGSLDTSFNGNGTYTVDLGGVDRIQGMHIQSDGKIIIAGYGNNDWYVQRLDKNGSLDATFGNTVPADGTYTVNLGTSDRIFAVTIQTDDKVLIAGYGNADNWYIQRLDKNGSLDATFNGNGTYTVDLDGFIDSIYAIQIQEDDKIIIAGYGNNNDWYVQRLNSNGSLDATFGNTVPTDGIYTVGFDDFSIIYEVQVQSDGKIIIAGHDDSGWYVQRLDKNGSLDTTFNGNGTYAVDLGGDLDYIDAMKIQTDGAILIAGQGNANWYTRRLLNDINPLTQIAANAHHGFIG